MSTHYDLIILGGGPAGLSAGLYAARNKTNTLMIEKSMIGGLAVYAELIENYPGFPDGVGGMDLGGWQGEGDDCENQGGHEPEWRSS